MKFLKIAAALCVALFLLLAFVLKLTEARQQPFAAPSLGSTERKAGPHSAAYTYLGCVYSRSKTLIETMVNLSSLSQMSVELRKARAGESEDYQDYLRERGASGIDDASIEDIHRQFQVSVDEMLTGSEGSSPSHITRGTDLFQSVLRLELATLNRLNATAR